MALMDILSIKVIYSIINFMNTRNFKCFQAVYEERNLQAAANKLFLSPQGLSKIIKSIEDEYGTSLFIRSKEGFIPTESGRLFYERSKTISRDLNDLFSSIEALNEKEKRFKVGFAAGTIRAIDVPSVASFMKENPEILASWYEYENENVIQQVVNDEISFGFVVGKQSLPGVVCEHVKAVDLVVYVYNGHRFWNESQIELKDLKDEKIISMNEKYHVYHDIVNACHLNGFVPNIVAKVDEGESLYLLAKNRAGLGISPRFFPETDEIKVLTIKDAYTWNVYGIYREDSADKDLANKFLQAVK